jgi:hypothetical protein
MAAIGFVSIKASTFSITFESSLLRVCVSLSPPSPSLSSSFSFF